MRFETDYRLENFIVDSSWEKLPAEVQERLKGCFVDLMGALVTGSRSNQFNVGLKLAEKIFGKGDIPVVGSDKTFNFLGAATAMGHSSNAYDIDDGHNLIRAHPGTAVIGPVLAKAYEMNISRNEFLNALNCAYEACIRGGQAIMDYYQNPQSTGTFGPMGIVGGVGKILGYSREKLNNAFSIADFNAPIIPGGRSVEYPSMNKDGVPFGVMVGCLALEEDDCGFEGNKNCLEGEAYKHYLDGIGEKYLVMDLYFKPYTCCRWAHPAIDSCLDLMKEHGFTKDDIESVTIKTFERATKLSKIIPKTVDEAQYNIAYPVAAAIVLGDFGWLQLQKEYFTDPEILAMMKRLSFEVDDELEAKFPAHRICRAEITLKDGRKFTSADCEPRGEAYENIQNDWLAGKFRRITGPMFAAEGQEKILSMILGDADLPVRAIVDEVNKPEYWKV